MDVVTTTIVLPENMATLHGAIVMLRAQLCLRNGFMETGVVDPDSYSFIDSTDLYFL